MRESPGSGPADGAEARPPRVSAPRPALLLLVAAVAAADQLSKLAVVSALEPGESRPLIGGVLHLSHIRNPGAAFGLFRGVPGLLLLAGLAALLVFGILLFSRPGPLAGAGTALVAGGALGNLLDRAFRPWPFRGTVVDFIDFRFWPAFNVADMAITAGAGLMLLSSFRERAADTGVHE